MALSFNTATLLWYGAQVLTQTSQLPQRFSYLGFLMGCPALVLPVVTEKTPMSPDSPLLLHVFILFLCYLIFVTSRHDTRMLNSTLGDLRCSVGQIPGWASVMGLHT